MSESLRRLRNRSRLCNSWLTWAVTSVGVANSIFWPRVEQSGHPPPLADGDHRLAGLGGHPLGGPVPGAGLVGREGAVGDEMDRAGHDDFPLVVEDDPAIHLGELGKPGRCELGSSKGEPAGTGRLDSGSVAENN